MVRVIYGLVESDENLEPSCVTDGAVVLDDDHDTWMSHVFAFFGMVQDGVAKKCKHCIVLLQHLLLISILG